MTYVFIYFDKVELRFVALLKLGLISPFLTLHLDFILPSFWHH